MTEIATTKQQVEAAARSASAKLLAFHEGLTPDERRALDAAPRRLAVTPDETAEDVAELRSMRSRKVRASREPSRTSLCTDWRRVRDSGEGD